MGDKLDEAIANLPMAGKEAAHMALQLGELARDDLLTSRDAFQKRRYANAAQGLQQGVEKGSKAFGLLVGTMKPNDKDMRKVGHDSFKAFLLDVWSFYPRLVSLITASNEVATTKLDDVPLFGGAIQKLKELTAATKSLIPPEEKLRSELVELEDLDPAVMWRASMQLDETNKWVKSAMIGIRQPVLFTGSTSASLEMAMKVLSMFKKMDSNTKRRMKLALGIAKTSDKLFCLSLLTAWHLEPARYPPGQKDYWDSDAYVESAPFVREIPAFVKYGRSAIEGAKETAQLCLR